ncbi:uncharacterized protein Z519_11903 [Cladophialophora bantiana CBS 173.52]|uniref:O-methyltransferase C-terminal domain-containing protein n=1 Tax=Cladophialophora bantiana (strain ATCC 10958 / CBS 173.52 / CDC B-1940 / NIH 8579) TaxID=1442370 RepID=A0A0D2H2R3_CLAB1|nr:uncharacterized protein Z519_11903 [Cladophialophora bantiana CBS 173.52]KIW87578.1 hypothetical protein Z519_11903 [Cladophialophora bantiana CBS 173.52]
MASQSNPIIDISKEILLQANVLSECLQRHSITVPKDLAPGSVSLLWTTEVQEVHVLRSTITSLTKRLDNLLEGPRGILHEYVSVNWEHGALYTLLDWKVFPSIPLDGTPIQVSQLAGITGLPSAKLLRLCRLVATAGILNEPAEGCFAHTAISEELVKDEGFRSWVGFQLFETRVASAHLSDSLLESRDFWGDGGSAFKHAWGVPMYAWHELHPEKGDRFAQAMESVSQSLDPGDGMIIDRLARFAANEPSKIKLMVIEVAGNGAFCRRIARFFPFIRFEVQNPSLEVVEHGESLLSAELRNSVRFRQRDTFGMRNTEEIELEKLGSNEFVRTTFLIRNMLWCMKDSEITRLLQTFVPVLQSDAGASLLICDLVSPAWATFEPYVERIYRRRDVTLMTMHNAKQRTAKEWTDLFLGAHPQYQVRLRH